MSERAQLVSPSHSAGDAWSSETQDGTFRVGAEGRTMLEDKTLQCRECGQEFVFSVGEQEFYQQKGLLNEPGVAWIADSEGARPRRDRLVASAPRVSCTR